MANIMKIDFKGRDEREQALINTVNALVDQMYQGRVPQAQKDIRTNKEDADAALILTEQAITEQDLLNIENGLLITDMDLRLMELEAANE